jgi:enoyl-[acyl-carrier protein] reductase I
MSTSTIDLRGRRGLVLGVGDEGGMGFLTARALRDAGAEIAISHRPERANARFLATALDASCALPLDAREDRSIERAFERLATTWDRLDFLVHAVVHAPAPALGRPLLELSRRDLLDTIDVALGSLLVATRFAMPLLSASSSPRIVALTSAAGARMTPNHHAVGIAKAALGGAMLYLAQELGPSGVLVNAVAFSLIATPGAERAVGHEAALATRNYLARKAPTRRSVEPNDVTRAVAWFASDACSSTTGEVLMVDGGFSRTYL